jgi:hypothetical protein
MLDRKQKRMEVGEMDLAMCRRVIQVCMTHGQEDVRWSGNEAVEPGDPDDCPFDPHEFTADSE